MAPAKIDAEIQALMNKTVFMIEEDREYQRKKHLIRDNAIGKAKMDLWARWQKQRARLEAVEAL